MNSTSKTLLTALLAMTMCITLTAPALADPLDGAGSTVTDDWGSDEHRLCNGCSPQVGNYIATWQVLLKADDAVTSACATVDGIFGSGTASATSRWQSSFGLAADGIVGPASWGRADNNLVRPLGDDQVTYRGRVITPVFSKSESSEVRAYFMERWNAGDGVPRFSNTDHPVNDMRKC